MIKLDISHLSWQLNKSFNISRGSKNTAETIEVKLTDNKFIGIGECVPYGRYDETLESVQKAILELKDEIENLRGQLNLFKDCKAPCIVFAEVTDSIQGDEKIPLSKRPQLEKDDWVTYCKKIKRSTIRRFINRNVQVLDG